MQGIPPVDDFRHLVRLHAMPASPSGSSSVSTAATESGGAGGIRSHPPSRASDADDMLYSAELDRAIARFLSKTLPADPRSPAALLAERRMLAVALVHGYGGPQPGNSGHQPTVASVLNLLKQLHTADFPALLRQDDAAGRHAGTDERLWRTALALAATSTGRRLLDRICPPIAGADNAAFRQFFDVAGRAFRDGWLPSPLPSMWMAGIDRVVAGMARRPFMTSKERATFTNLLKSRATLRLVLEHALDPKQADSAKAWQLRQLADGLDSDDRRLANRLLEKLPDLAERGHETESRRKRRPVNTWFTKRFTPQRYRNPLGQLARLSPHTHLPPLPADAQHGQADKLEKTVMRMKPGTLVDLYSGGEISATTRSATAVLAYVYSSAYIRGNVEIGGAYGKDLRLLLHHAGTELQLIIAETTSVRVPLFKGHLRLPANFFGGAGGSAAFAVTPGLDLGTEYQRAIEAAAVIRYRAPDGKPISEDHKTQFLALIRRQLNGKREARISKDGDTVGELLKACPAASVQVRRSDKDALDFTASAGIWTGLDLSLGHQFGIAAGPGFSVNFRHHRDWWRHIEKCRQHLQGSGSSRHTSLSLDAAFEFGLLHGVGNRHYRALLAGARPMFHKQLLPPNGIIREATLTEEALHIVAGHAEHTFDNQAAFRRAAIAPIEDAVARGTLSRAWADQRIRDIDRHIAQAANGDRPANAFHIDYDLTPEALDQINRYRDLAWYAALVGDHARVNDCVQQGNALLASSEAWNIGIVGPLARIELNEPSLLRLALPVLPRRSSGVRLRYRLADSHPVINIGRERLAEQDGTLCPDEMREATTRASTHEFLSKQHSAGMRARSADGARAARPKPRAPTRPNKPSESELPRHASHRPAWAAVAPCAAPVRRA